MKNYADTFIVEQLQDFLDLGEPANLQFSDPHISNFRPKEESEKQNIDKISSFLLVTEGSLQAKTRFDEVVVLEQGALLVDSAHCLYKLKSNGSIAFLFSFNISTIYCEYLVNGKKVHRSCFFIALVSDYMDKLLSLLNDYINLVVNPLLEARKKSYGLLVLAELTELIYKSLEMGHEVPNKLQIFNMVSHVNSIYPLQGYSRQKLAELIGITPQYLNSVIKYYRNISYQQYNTLCRLEHARILFLNNEKVQVSEVAKIIGFINISHFTKTFRKYYGFSPSDFIKEVKSADCSSMKDLEKINQTDGFSFLSPINENQLPVSGISGEKKCGTHIICNCLDTQLKLSIYEPDGKVDQVLELFPNLRHQFGFAGGDLLKIETIDGEKIKYYLASGDPSLIIFN